ncbi:MAG: hypothetical protein AB1650_00915 [Candidatus Omnitrophota bacterium]
MKNKFMFSLLIVSLSGCASLSSLVSPKPRAITLGDTVYNEETSGKFICWECRDFIDDGRILVEVGIFSDPKLKDVGFVLFDGSNSGNITYYQRRGINHRWDWGPDWNDFSFIIEPDGTGLFYDFSNAKSKSIKANQVFKCWQR